MLDELLGEQEEIEIFLRLDGEVHMTALSRIHIIVIRVAALSQESLTQACAGSDHDLDSALFRLYVGQPDVVHLLECQYTTRLLTLSMR